MNHGYGDFQHRVYRAGILPNLFSALFIFMYSAFIITMPVKIGLSAFFIALIITAGAQFIFAPLTNILITRGLSVSLERWKTQKTDETARTELLRRVMTYPLAKAVETFLYFLLCALILALGYDRMLHLDRFVNIISFCGCVFGAYLSMLLALSFSERLCSEEAQELVKQGLSADSVKTNHSFGLPLKALFILYAAVPAVFSGLLAFLVVKAGSVPVVIHENGAFVTTALSAQELQGFFFRLTPSRSVQFLRMAFVSCTNVAVMSVLAALYFGRIEEYTSRMQKALSGMNGSNVTNAALVPTDLSNEMAYTMFLINQTILLFRSVLERTAGISGRVLQSAQDLVVISRQAASTSLEQSAGVKEILATMEETDRLSHSVENKIGEVHTVAVKMSQNVENGSDTVKDNLQKMLEITAANHTTITGIQNLCDKINGIWDIVTMINSVTDQTKIIAFNAELEAADVSKSDCNFHTVAGEIRALADSTMESTAKIKEQIQEIQMSSDKLIVTARSCMEKISEGSRLTMTFETKFDDIRRASELTAASSDEIAQIIRQQTAAFEQIVVTLRQISTGVENFSSSAQIISGAAGSLTRAAAELEDLTGSTGEQSAVTEGGRK